MSGFLSSSSSIEITDKVISHCDSVLKHTITDVTRLAELETLGRLVSSLERFVNGYASIEDESLDTDDEILNWVFTEVPSDFCSAIWLLASGFYKASASSLRNALDIATASLYFQLRQNSNKTSGYNIFYAQWDRGARQTPNWGEMKPYISAHPSVVRFKLHTNIDPVELVYSHFKYLCSFTHTSAYTPEGDPVTAINMTGVAPAFDAIYFARGCDLTRRTVSLIAILWQVAFPSIIGSLPLGPVSAEAYVSLFPPPIGPLALQHR